MKEHSAVVGIYSWWRERASLRLRLLAWMRRTHAGEALPLPLWRSVLLVGIVSMGLASMIVLYRIHWPSQTDPTRLFVVGNYSALPKTLEQLGLHVATVQGTGYDGQWFLGIAFDPLGRTTYIAKSFDLPYYRYERPLLGMLGWLLAFGNRAVIPSALLAVEVISIGLGSMAMGRIFIAYGSSRWLGLLFLAIPGVLIGIGFGTAEPLGLALAILGMSWVAGRQYKASAIAFIGAGLTKETYLGFALAAAIFIFVNGCINHKPWRKHASVVVLPGVICFLLWWVYVKLTLPPDPTFPNQVFTLPGVGWVELLQKIVAGSYAPDLPIDAWGALICILTLSLFLVTLYHVLRRCQHSIFSYAAFLWVLYGLAIDGALLGRFVSAQRALAPAVVAVIMCLVTSFKSDKYRAQDISDLQY